MTSSTNNVPKHQNSDHLQAIADINYYTFDYLMNRNADETEYRPYLLQWIKYCEMAKMKQEEEYYIRINKNWKNTNKNETKKLWKLINWKDKQPNCSKEEKPSATMIDRYFRSIFLSSKTSNTPKEIGNDIGPDAIHPSISKLFTPSLKNALVKLLNRMLRAEYPECWKEQLLISLNKKGSTINNPKLRGIAISSLLPKIFDIILFH